MANTSRKTVTPSTIAGNYYVHIYVLTAQDILDKKGVLPHTPSDSNDVTMVIKHGPRQFPPEDFIVSGNELQWDGRALELDLSENDKKMVQYAL